MQYRNRARRALSMWVLHVQHPFTLLDAGASPVVPFGIAPPCSTRWMYGRRRPLTVRAYSKAAKDRSLEIEAVAIRTRAERRLGQMLAEGRERGEVATGSAILRGSQEVPRDKTTLTDIGVTKQVSVPVRHIGKNGCHDEPRGDGVGIRRENIRDSGC